MAESKEFYYVRWYKWDSEKQDYNVCESTYHYDTLEEAKKHYDKLVCDSDKPQIEIHKEIFAGTDWRCGECIEDKRILMKESMTHGVEDSEKNRMHLFDRVCELEEENSELKELVPKWISVKDELPYPSHPSDPDYRQYLIVADGYMYVADYSYDKHFETCYSFYVDGEEMTGVTHWCKIPEPPKGEL